MHVKCVCTKAKRILGLVHKSSNKWSNVTTLYITHYTLCHVDYTATVWSPHLQKGVYIRIGEYLSKVCF